MGAQTSQEDIQHAIDNDATIIDVRTTVEHAVYGHPRSINIPLSEIETSDQLPNDKDKPIVVHCLSGHRSETAKEILHEKGYTNVVNGGSVTNIMNFK
jgi:rhodanese-related sulfurtransferase